MDICDVCSSRTQDAQTHCDMPLREAILDLLSILNACPAIELPHWTLNPTQANVRMARPPQLWDDGDNIAGSVLMLILLRPLVFGMPWLPPLRIFGVPPPTSLLHLDACSIGRPPHDDHRTIVVEALLSWFRYKQDAKRGDLLQQAWMLVKSMIAQQDLGGLPAWSIARPILNATPYGIATSVAQGSQDIWPGSGGGGGSTAVDEDPWRVLWSEEEWEPEQEEGAVSD